MAASSSQLIGSGTYITRDDDVDGKRERKALAIRKAPEMEIDWIEAT
jgi:hypothetical protein